MIIKKTNRIHLLVVGAILLSLFIYTGCNNSGDKKSDKPNDSNSVIKPDSASMIKPALTDSNSKAKENMPDTSKGVKLVCIDGGMDTSISAPKTDVMLYVDGKSTKIATIYGEGHNYDKESYKDMGIPSTALSACGAWWAGGGDYFYVVAKNGKPVVYQGSQDEGQKHPGYGWHPINIKTK